MQNKNTLSYVALIGIHLLIGFAVFVIPFLAKIYALLIIGVGLFIVIKTRNGNNQALIVAAYLTGAEVLLRMKNGVPLYEFGKYGVIFFLFIGIIYRGFSRQSFIYWVFILILLPGAFYSFFTLSSDEDIRKAIMFNLSGPICLAVSSIYCFNRPISFKQLNHVLLAVSLPILSVLIYLVFYTPSIKEVVISTGSNFATSGGFGPNQVSTVLGLATFVFLSRVVLESSNKFNLIFWPLLVDK